MSLKKNERERSELFLEAQVFTYAIMQSLIDNASMGSRFHILADNARSIAAQAIEQVVTEHPKMAKKVDELFTEITVTAKGNDEQV